MRACLDIHLFVDLIFSVFSFLSLLIEKDTENLIQPGDKGYIDFYDHVEGDVIDQDNNSDEEKGKQHQIARFLHVFLIYPDVIMLHTVIGVRVSVLETFQRYT